MNFKPHFTIFAFALAASSIATQVAAASPKSTAPAKPATPAKPAASSHIPSDAVMKQFFNYLDTSHQLWLGDSRGACAYSIDPTGIRTDGDDRFFLARISPGNVGTGCRGVLAFRVMQADCKAEKLYEFVREQKPDIRSANWERYETVLYDNKPAGKDKDAKDAKPEIYSQKLIGRICQ
jgi:hypothetical protein